MNLPVISTALGVLLLTSWVWSAEGVAAPAAQAEVDPGQELFVNYGCSLCHGAGGVNPTSRYVPILRGKPASYIVENAIGIFDGERDDAMSKLMHDQYCAETTAEGACADAPSRAELETIARWLESSITLPAKKQTPQGRYLTAKEAYDMVGRDPKGVLFLDVRTRAEAVFVGVPTMIDALVPFVEVGDWDAWDDEKKTVKLQANDSFIAGVDEALERKGLGKDGPIILMCRSGSRSAKAARILHVAGYDEVYTVTDGFEGDEADEGPRQGERTVNGWKNTNLPWTYELERAKLVDAR